MSKSDDDVSHTDTVQHRIDLTDEKPFKQRYRLCYQQPTNGLWRIVWNTTTFEFAVSS